MSPKGLGFRVPGLWLARNEGQDPCSSPYTANYSIVEDTALHCQLKAQSNGKGRHHPNITPI